MKNKQIGGLSENSPSKIIKKVSGREFEKYIKNPEIIKLQNEIKILEEEKNELLKNLGENLTDYFYKIKSIEIENKILTIENTISLKKEELKKIFELN